MTADTELESERAHLRYARECLDIMRQDAEAIADHVGDALASESLGKLRAARLQALASEPDAPAFFGRTDREPDDRYSGRTDREPDDRYSGRTEVLHIGRRHVRDPQRNPVVIDWRAPIARPFYRATPADRMGVALRRRFGFGAGEHAGQLTSYEDEHLDRGERLGLDSQLLRDEIERPRVGPMRDIVATIQPDQDELVRADLDSSLCIQGAPGTGKTAVGLHRAAYLLYTFPERLRRSGVLVIGPNAAFLHYITQVLPALGEGGIEQTTAGDLVAHAPIRAEDPVEAAVLKGDARMAELLRRAVLSHISKPTDDVVALAGTRRFRVGAHHLRRYVDDARRALQAGDLRWDAARERLRLQVAEDVRRQREENGGAPSDAETRAMARSRPVREAIDAVWPALDPMALLARLYGDAQFLSRCAGDALSEQEQQLLRWDRIPRSARSARWSAADLVLLDELTSLVAPPATYVHVVVDEAQDLSAMQCRAIARRCPLGSFTVLGDLAQATTPWAPGDWAASLRHLGCAEAPVRPLTAGYRVPAEVIAVANRLLPHIAPDLPPGSSIRSGPGIGIEPAAQLIDVVRRARDAEGSIGVIVPDDRAADALRTLRASGIDAEPLDADADPRVTVVPASAAKGLEYDTVVLVEPALIVAAEATRINGLRRLYVVLTRAVTQLIIVGDEATPPELALPELALPAPSP